jgi:LPXTG-motif cell wall-anchored protein
MGIFNRRYAAIGWLVWNIGKRMGKRKARQAVPGIDRETKKPNRPAILSGLAALGGALWIFGKKKKRGGGPTDFGE